MGVATILLVFEAARRLAGLPAAIAAGFAIAVAPLAVEHAHYLTTDVPAAFLCAASLLATIVASRSTRWWPWAVAGLTAGLAGSMKWDGLAVAHGAVARVGAGGARPRPLHPRAATPTPPIVVGAAAAGLIVTTPAVLLAPAEVADWLARQIDSYDGPNPGPPVNSLVFHLQSLVETFGSAVAHLRDRRDGGMRPAGLARRRPCESRRSSRHSRSSTSLRR